MNINLVHNSRYNFTLKISSNVTSVSMIICNLNFVEPTLNRHVVASIRSSNSCYAVVSNGMKFKSTLMDWPLVT